MSKKGHKIEQIEDISCLKRHDISMDAKPGARSLLTEPRVGLSERSIELDLNCLDTLRGCY